MRLTTLSTVLLSACLTLTSEVLSVETPLTPVPFTQVRLTDQFWSPRLETNRAATIPHVFKMCETTGRIDNFAKAAGVMPGEFRGIYYDDSDVYKAIEGAAYSLTTHPDPELDKYLDVLIAKIAAAQRPDGYLNTYFTLTGLDARYTNLKDKHELYCAGHLFEAAVAHHRATGKRTLLDVATKFADQIASVFGPGKRRDVEGHEEIELALVKLADATNNPAYRDLARHFLHLRGNPEGREKLYGPYYQDHVPVAEQATPTGHAVRQMYLLCAVADLAPLRPEFLPALDTMWDNLVNKRMYVTGGIGSRHDGEAFGDDYELPNETAYAETCAAIGNALWQHRMNLLHADAKYADTLEQILYNGFLSGVNFAGDRFFYVNPLASRGHHHRKEWYGTACCPVNVVRFLPSLPGYVYATSPGKGGVPSLYVNLYAASEATVHLPSSNDRPTRVRVTQETRYPWDGAVRLTIDPDPTTPFDLRLRIPAWAGRPKLSVDGRPVDDYRVENGYAVLDGTWKSGTVELTLPLQPRRVHAHPQVAANAGRTAVQYGPLVYCAESADQPDTRLASVYLPADAKLTAEHRADLLNGVTTITSTARALAADSKNPKDAKPVPLTLVPYYAWDHRAAGDMMVWLAEDPSAARPAPPATVAGTARASASHVNPTDTLDALADGDVPQNSADPATQRFTWWNHRGTAEWVQYDFPKPTSLTSAEVYFYDDAARNGHCRPPASWRLSYKDGDQWKPIDADYRTATDRFNRVTFPAVTTTALRLEVQLQKDFSAGILEWRVN
jgi:DUF1680 family protein